MTRPSSEKPDFNWDSQDRAGEPASAEVPWGSDDSEVVASTPASISPFVWGAAAFAGAVAVGLVLGSRRRSRWSLLTINITPAPGSVPARGPLWSTLGAAAARFAFQTLISDRSALAGVDFFGDGSPSATEARPAARSGAGLENGRHGS
jgi:hypothetical protein